MKPPGLVAALVAGGVPGPLAGDLIESFISMREDVITDTLERSTPGKFVESIVQILQFTESGEFEKKPDVDGYLRGLDSRSSSLDDGLRVCGARIARSMYTLRNKRNVAHKADIDPNSADLRFLHYSAQWLVTELLRVATNITPDEASRLVELVQRPVGGLVEDFGDRKLVLENMLARDEVLVLLHNDYPGSVAVDSIAKSMDRVTRKTVLLALRQLWSDKLAEGDLKIGFKLTSKGFNEATAVLRRFA